MLSKDRIVITNKIIKRGNFKKVKMAENTTINTLVKLIIVVFVLVIAIFGIMYLNNVRAIKDLFPDFTKENKQVNWNEEFYLEHPELLYFYIGGKKGDIFFSYLKNSDSDKGQWSWTKLSAGQFTLPKKSNFLSVDISYHSSFVNLDEKNKNFIIGLRGKSPEEGLRDIVNRVLKNDEGFTFFQDVAFLVYIDGELAQQQYEVSDPVLRDLDSLIDRVNKEVKIYLRKKESKKINQ